MRITNPSFPSTETNYNWAAVPNASMTAVVANKNYYVTQLSLANTTAGALTVTVQNAAGTQVVPAVSVAANQLAIVHWPEGTIFVGGLSWQASGAGVNGEIRGYTGAW